MKEERGNGPDEGDEWKRPLLRRLGKEIASARSALMNDDGDPLSQMDVAARTGLTQSYIARLERGAVSDPEYPQLTKVARVLGIDFERLVATIIEEKYLVSRAKTSILYNGAISLAELARWESLEVKKELWIVAPKFVDQAQQEFGDAVHELLNTKGGSVIFFIPTFFIKDFNDYRLNRHGNHKNLNAFALSKGEETIMTNGYVIGDPNEIPSGYIISNDDYGTPYLAIKMTQIEIIRKVEGLKQLIEEKFRHEG